MLKLDGIRKTFHKGTPDEKKAINGLSLQLNPGDFVTIIGSNGAGKSTLMNLIAGALKPDEGTISINGQTMNPLTEHKRSSFIGRVFQDPMAGTAPTMTIEENLAIAYSRNRRRSLFRAINTNRKEFFIKSLKTLHLGLEHRLNAKVGLLSGGERQALSLLMATFTEPAVLLLDEHTAALDPTRAQLITDLTGEIVSRLSLTTLMITHNMNQALALGNRLIMMDNGEIILDIPDSQKRDMTVPQLLKEFERCKGAASDRMLLSK